jgi:hypothetical protein
MCVGCGEMEEENWIINVLVCGDCKNLLLYKSKSVNYKDGLISEQMKYDKINMCVLQMQGIPVQINCRLSTISG